MVCNQNCLYFPDVKNIEYEIIDGVKYNKNSKPYICLYTDNKIIKKDCPFFKERKMISLEGNEEIYE